MHTDIPTHADLERLPSVRDAACVSIYLSTSPEEPGERDRLQFKALEDVPGDGRRDPSLPRVSPQF